MHIYRAPARQFVEDVTQDGFGASVLQPVFVAEKGFEPSRSQISAWDASLRALADVLRNDSLLRSHIFVELRMPLCSRWADAVLTGYNRARQRAAVVVELKQWTLVEASILPEHVTMNRVDHLHPSAQVRAYSDYLAHYHSAFVEGGVKVASASYLHNMEDAASIRRLRDPERFGLLLQSAPLFTKREAARFASWLLDEIGHGDGAAVAEEVAIGKPTMTPRLLDVVADAVQGTAEWRLLDEQRKAFFTVTSRVAEARGNGTKAVVLVRGGPGTGKSVIAIQLLAHAARNGWTVVHATGSKALKTVLQAKTQAFAAEKLKKIFNVKTKAALPVHELFVTFADVARLGAERANAIDLMVGDEAHRLWDFRRVKFQNYNKQLSNTPMAQEVMRACRVCAFFLDENQSVRAGEIGSSAHIREQAATLGIPVFEIDLNLQFRCSGSESYVNWVDGVLGYRTDLDGDWLRYNGYAFEIATSMDTLATELAGHQAAGRRSRVVAGYCWRWSKPDPIRGLPYDVQDPRFGDWKRPWIEKTGQSLMPLQNQYFRWATDDECFDQVGSIYSVQGFEFDYVGVIWGEDLVWRDGRWVAQLDRNKDTAFKKDLRVSGESATDKLRNIYRVLLTRGMLGTSLFVLDPETRAHIEECVNRAQISTVPARA